MTDLDMKLPTSFALSIKKHIYIKNLKYVDKRADISVKTIKDDKLLT